MRCGWLHIGEDVEAWEEVLDQIDRHGGVEQQHWQRGQFFEDFEPAVQQDAAAASRGAA